MFDALKKVGSAFVEKVGNVGKSTAIIGLTAATAVSAMAETTGSGSVTLPSTGIDISSYITAAMSELNTTLGAAIGVIFAITIISAGIAWTKRGFRSR